MIIIDYRVKKLWIHRIQSDYDMWIDLLNRANLREEKNLDETIGLFDGDKLIATGSYQKNIMKCMVVCKDYTGGTVMTQLISELMNRIYDNGHRSVFAYTKPKSAESFSHLGFDTIVKTEDVVFMERATDGLDSYLEDLKSSYVSADKVAAIVMNANPFTKGHRHLIETAVKASDVVHIFVVSEDRSLFPTTTRMHLVEEGTKDLDNIYVHETRDYIVSSATFPAYFLSEDTNVTKVQAALDAQLFKEKIAPVLGITHRFVGEEPYSKATEIYNNEMQKVFGEELELVIIPRLTLSEDGASFISATKVREAISERDIDQTKPYLPETTYNFLKTEEGKKIIEKAQKERTDSQ